MSGGAGMSPTTVVRVEDIAKHAICVASEDGIDVYKKILPILQSGGTIVLDFTAISTLTSAFLNAAIGQLYADFEASYIEDHLSFSGLDEYDAVLVDKVKENAQRYFDDPVKFDQARQSVLGDIDE
jgi:hypothetical protein